MKKYFVYILVAGGLTTGGGFLKSKVRKDRAIARVDALNQLRSELIRRKVLQSTSRQDSFSVENTDLLVERLDTLPETDTTTYFEPLSDRVLMEKYNYELRTIYGLDNRVDINCRGITDRASFLGTTDPYIVSARKVCALIPKELLTLKGDFYELTAGTLNETKYKTVKPCSTTDGICFNNQIYNESIKYANQRAGADCSGFGYKNDLIVTANHCFDGGRKITDFYYVFGFVYYPGLPYHLIPAADVYTASSPIPVSSSISDDYRIIRVSRPLQPWQRAVLNTNELRTGDIVRTFA